MSYQGKILVVDDEPDIREVIRLLLEGENYEIIEATDGNEAIKLSSNDLDLIILDIMMPGLDGVSACEEIRKTTNVPILFLSAKSQDTDKAMGFSAGGDDYLVKPFSYTELISRVKAMIRRYRQYGSNTNKQESSEIFVKNMILNKDTAEVCINGKEIRLTDIEFKILLLLATNPTKVFSAQNIFESIWNEPYYYTSNNTVMVHIRNLRKKINTGKTENDCIVKTVWGKGYKIN